MGRGFSKGQENWHLHVAKHGFSKVQKDPKRAKVRKEQGGEGADKDSKLKEKLKPTYLSQ